MSRLEELLAQVHLEVAQNMLADLRDPEKRTPALYNAIIKFLKDNGIEIEPKSMTEKEAAEKERTSAAQIAALSTELPPVLADDEEFHQFH
ncbi:putative packaging maturation protein A [Ralstonia phage RpT1]|nr:putative packaging maturation protein A [Ralstonia phage RpT1]